MTPGALARAVAEDARRAPGALVGGALGIALGIGALVFFSALGVGIREGFLGRALARLPIGTVEIRPRGGVPVGFLKFDGSELVIRPLDDAALQNLRDLPGVERVFPRTAALFPMRALGGRSLLGRDVHTDVFASGVDAEFLKDDLPPGTVFADNPAGPIPAVVSRQLLELFNRAVAPSLGIPGLTEEATLGFAFTLVLGESFSSGRNTGGERLTVQVVAVSERAMMLGITVPRATVERWNRRWAEQDQKGYSSAYIVTRDGAALTDVVKAAESMGYTVEQNAKLASNMVLALMMTWVAVAVLILVVAGFNVAQTLAARVQSRRRELGLMRAVGATRADIRHLILAEALGMGLVAALAGVALGTGAALAADHLSARLLPKIPFQPESWFAFPAWLVGGAVLLALGCAALGAWPPARAAANVDPARALEG
ncbi:MAG: ABC transporter permease [Deltaproteobacteria bacterium]|nr:ABC transporter permease [Deltaproteobacteria bacterium]